METYWQSDGPQPHLANIQFRRKTTVEDICVFADYKQDESYTPNRYKPCLKNCVKLVILIIKHFFISSFPFGDFVESSKLSVKHIADKNCHVVVSKES